MTAVRKRTKGRPSGTEEQVGRGLVIGATKRLLRRFPPNELTQARIAEAAKVDPKLVRYYFGNLNNLFNEVLSGLLDDLAAKMTAATETLGTPKDRMRARIKALTQFYIDNPHWWDMLAARVYHTSTKWAANLRTDFNMKGFGRLMAVLDDGRKSGEFRADFDARLLYLALIGLSEIFVTGKPILGVLMPNTSRNDMQEQYIDFIVDMVFRGIEERR
jgi:AcrR family transcriptional regulator